MNKRVAGKTARRPTIHCMYPNARKFFKSCLLEAHRSPYIGNCVGRSPGRTEQSYTFRRAKG